MLAFTLILVGVLGASGQLRWDDPTLGDSPCGFPTPVKYPIEIINAIRAAPQGFKMYVSMGSKSYYRWQYEKVKNIPADNQTQLDSLKPRVIFPDITGVFTLTEARVTLFDPPTAYYKVRCIPNNLALTNASCTLPEANPGSAPPDFGGLVTARSTIWADNWAVTEWHCMKGGIQTFNIISLNSTLSQEQIDANKAIVLKLGFKEENFEFQTY